MKEISEIANATEFSKGTGVFFKFKDDMNIYFGNYYSIKRSYLAEEELKLPYYMPLKDTTHVGKFMEPEVFFLLHN